MSTEKQKTILLVDDEVVIAMAEKKRLEKYGYKVVLAHSGKEAVATVGKTPGIDLILMDIDLGTGMDGTEAAAIILGQRDLPVVFLSSHTEPAVVEKTEKITSYGYVVKNSSITVLDASIKMAFKLFEAKIKEQEKENALRESEEKYHTLFREMLDGFALHEIICDREGTPVDYLFLAVNPALERMTGLKAADLIGHTVLEIMPGTERHWIETYGKVALTGEPALFENFAIELGKHFHVTAFRPNPNQFACIFADVTEHKRVEASLRESEERYRSILNASPDSIAITDMEGRIIMISPTTLTMFRIEREAVVLGHFFSDFVAPNDRDRALANVALLSQGTMSGLGEYQGVRLDGSTVELEVNGEFIRDANGQPRQMLFIIRDISARKRTEALYRLLFEQSPDGIVIIDPVTMRILEFNETAHRQLGYSREDFSNLSIPDIEAAETPQNTRSRIARVMTDGLNTFETRQRTQQGDIRDIQVTAQFTTRGNRPIYHCIWRDISEHKRAEQALHESEDRMRAIVEGTPHLFFYTQDADANTTYVSPTIERITGYDADTWRKQKDWFITDSPINRSAKEMTRSNLQGEVQEGSRLLEIRHAQGHTIRLEVYEYPITKDGRIAGLQGVAHDITERQLAEQALRRSEAELANALQMTKAGHWQYDVDRDRFTFNDNFYRIFRTTAAAVGGYQMSSGDYARRFCHPDDMAMVGIETQGAIESPDPHYSRQIEHRILYADGEVGYIAVRFFIAKNPQGRTVTTYGVNQDISERKRAEEEIKRQLKEKETLLQEVHHRIKNNIAAIGGILSLSLRSITHPEAISVLQDAAARVDSMRILYDKLLLSKDFQEVSVKNYMESLTDAITSLFPDRARIRFNQQFVDFQLDPKRLFPLGIIINELLTNIMKYAFAGKKGGQIRLSLTKVDRRVTLVLQDNGVGIPDGFDAKESKGFGLTLVRMLSQQLGGSFSIEKDAGTRCKVEFDI